MKVKNSPEKIYLVVGEAMDIADTSNFNNLHGVSWCDERIYEADIEYVRVDLKKKEIKKNCCGNWDDQGKCNCEAKNYKEIIERRIVTQEWYETEFSKTGWDSQGWRFDDGTYIEHRENWTVVEHIRTNKFGNPIIGVAEREVKF